MLHSGLSSLAVPGFDAAADGRKKKICVIGAGASGIAAAKIVADHPDELELVVLEKGSQVGGLWVYTDHTHVDELNQPVHSSVYKYLRTNSPKEIMHFPDYPHFTDPEDRSCVSHETVLKYLTDYADHFGLNKFIKVRARGVFCKYFVRRMRDYIFRSNWHFCLRVFSVMQSLLFAQPRSVFVFETR